MSLMDANIWLTQPVWLARGPPPHIGPGDPLTGKESRSIGEKSLLVGDLRLLVGQGAPSCPRAG